MEQKTRPNYANWISVRLLTISGTAGIFLAALFAVSLLLHAPFAFEDVFYSKKIYPNLNALVGALSKEVAEIRFVDTRKNDFVPNFLRTPLIAGEMGLLCGKK